jgi:hypothetical protein
MRFLTFVKASEKYRGSPPPQALMDAMGQFIGENIRTGAFIDGGGLYSTKYTVEVTLRQGKIAVTDGPFTEAKEVIGGYAILELPSREAAIENGKKFMELHAKHWPEWEGTSEIRQIAGPDEMPNQN